MDDLPKQSYDLEHSNKKTQDKAVLLPLLGLLFLMPPIVGIFQVDVKILNIPFTLIYLFVIWAMLILCAALLSRKLSVESTKSHFSNETNSQPRS